MDKLKTLKLGLSLVKHVGLSWTFQRLYYEAKIRTGLHKRSFPKRNWKKEEWKYWLKKPASAEILFREWKKNRPLHFINPTKKEDYKTVLTTLFPEALAYLKNAKTPSDFKYFFKHKVNVSFPQDWFRNPLIPAHHNINPDLHWTAYPMKAPASYIDLKFVWEYGRFAIVYLLVRSYYVSGDETIPELYWELIESWANHNPPNTGPHWRCGQETALRLMAWCFGLYAFANAPATTAQRFANLLGWVAAQAERISKDTIYAHLQQNNHSMSEGVGLYTVGLLFPQLTHADKWKRQGKQILEEEALLLVKKDGTFIQKSHNYHRLFLHDYLYAFLLARLNGDTFSKACTERIKKAGRYLLQILDYDSGQVPNFGNNDGALILPLNHCDFTDFRPITASIHYFFNKKILFDKGLYHEDLIWFFGAEALTAPKDQPTIQSVSYEIGGIYTIRGAESWCFTHAESFKDRPVHADALSVDLWWRGLNIAIDAGTYLYYGTPPWQDGLKHTHVHNTIEVDGKDQMERGFRFMWAHWHNCVVKRGFNRTISPTLSYEWLQMEHDGYQRLTSPVLHKRAILYLNDKDTWIIIDDVVGQSTHTLKLQWLLNDFPYNHQSGLEDIIELNTPKGNYHINIWCNHQSKTSNIIRGNENSGTRGFRSLYYGHKDAVLSYICEVNAPLPIRYISIFSPQQITASYQKNSINFSEMTIPLNDIGVKEIFKTS